MKEILFRAKSKFDKDNKWVYGDLLQGENSYISTKEEFYSAVVTLDGHLSTFVELVDKETIGQYTGLKDKNGTKIFEGDIVRLYDKMCNIHWTAIVEFGNPNGEYNWGYQLKLLKILEPTGTKNCYWNKDILVWVEMPDIECEVIGNVCDNPELLEKVEE